MDRIRCLSAMVFTACLFFGVSWPAYALLSMELTQGVAGAIPVAVTHFDSGNGVLPQDVAAIVRNDLQNSGRFSVKTAVAGQPASYFRASGVNAVLYGKIQPLAGNRYRVAFELRDPLHGKPSAPPGPLLLKGEFMVPAMGLRGAAHRVSDLVYHQLTGVRGVFSTRLAYVVVEPAGHGSPVHYRLEVSDQDGDSPRALVVSSDPVMSPAWSPDGRQIAYVSFEKRRAAIWLQNVATGVRRRISAWPGINGAPAFSPDGKKLALVLSRDGAPNLYLFDIASGQLTRLTHDWSINTEPAFAPDGKSLVFTSNRGGGPQIYQLALADRRVSRVTYEGDYNARASYARDGRHLVLLNRTGGIFSIAALDLDTGLLRQLTSASGSDSESPSVAPNGEMVLYGTLQGGKSTLGMASLDGTIRIRLPAREGEVQDPAWSPWAV